MPDRAERRHARNAPTLVCLEGNVGPDEAVATVGDDGVVAVEQRGDLGADAVRVDRYLWRTGELRFARRDLVRLFAQARDPVAGVERRDRVSQLLEHCLGIADDANADRRTSPPDLRWVDVDLDEVLEPREEAVPEEVVRLGTDDQQDVRLVRHVGPVPPEAQGMVVGDDAAARLARHERDAGVVDERCEGGAAPRPPHPAARHDRRPRRALEQRGGLLDQRRRCRQRSLLAPVRAREEDIRLLDVRVDDVDRYLQVHGPGTPRGRLFERGRDVLLTGILFISHPPPI